MVVAGNGAEREAVEDVLVKPVTDRVILPRWNKRSTKALQSYECHLHLPLLQRLLNPFVLDTQRRNDEDAYQTAANVVPCGLYIERGGLQEGD